MQSTSIMEMKFEVFAFVPSLFKRFHVGGRVQGELKNQLMSYSIHDGTGEINGKIYISQNNDEVTHMYISHRILILVNQAIAGLLAI